MSGEMYLDPREQTIRLFYRSLLGREADIPGLKPYLEGDRSLEMIYMSLYTSDEAEKYRAKLKAQENILKAEGTLPLTLAMFVRDNEDSVEIAINSVKSVVKEVVILDTGSVDRTAEVCKDLGARVYKINTEFDSFDFGAVRTLTAHLARQPWVLGLDSDEIMVAEDYDRLAECVAAEDIDIWGLPRKRWLDLEMTTQLEQDVYPDWQYRLFRNSTDIYYRRRVHEVIEGSDRRREAEGGPHIHHFQDVFKKGDRLVDRNNQYKKLQKLDVDEGVEHTEQAVQDLDER